MTKPLVLGLIRATLPRYYPERHGVWLRAEAALEVMCSELDSKLVLAQGMVTDGKQAAAALDHFREEGVDFVLVLHGGFTMGDVARTVAASQFPLGFWSVPEPVRTGDVQLNNFVSLNMSLSISSMMRDRISSPVQWYHGAPEDAELCRCLATTLKALTARKALRAARIAVIGGLASTFYNMEVSTSDLRRKLGVEVEDLDMGILQARMSQVSSDRAAAEVALMRAAAPVRGVSDHGMDLSARCSLALSDIAEAGGFAALAVSDWPALQEAPGLHPGAAFSWLETRRNIPATSEGDVLGAASQLVAKAVTGQVGTVLDMTEPDFPGNRVLMWHGGGGPLQMAGSEGAAWINHPMIGREKLSGADLGAIADFQFAPGAATVFRIAKSATALFTLAGRIAPHQPSGFDGCRGWLADLSIGGAAVSVQDVVSTVMAHGVEHHFILIPGSHTPVLEEFAAWSGLKGMGAVPFSGHLRPVSAALG